jgi:aminoglycoside phosphotransferase (APT) family kinase protein
MSIPEEKREAVARALSSAFGTACLDGTPVRLSGGLSGATLLRIRVGGIAYVLRIEPRKPLSGQASPARTYACMRRAADALLAPRVWYADAEDGVSIVDLVPHTPLADYPGDGEGLITELAQSLHVLHALPPFPEATDFLQGVAGLIAAYRAAPLLAASATDEVFARFEDLSARYRPRPEDLVASHNDLNPANILYDGRRLWLIDWEVAFRADRWLDLAAVANWFIEGPAREDLLLRTYLKAEPTADERDRLRLMRIVNHVYYGVVFLLGAAAERPGSVGPAADLGGPTLSKLRQGLRTGEFDITAWENRVLYGKARLAEALAGFRGGACDEALQRLAA